MSNRLPIALAAALAAFPARAAAQTSDALYARINALSGWEIRGYRFDPGLAVKSVSQWSVPLVLIAPVGRKMSVDLTTQVASGSISSYGAGTETLSGLTDTQVRLLYTLERDRLVTSLSVNVPTGKHSVSTSQFQVAGAVGANYLSFPIANFGTAFGVTGGVAYARPAGAWNVGLSGSLRYLRDYAPFSDQPVSYSPGLEGRVRGGVDRLLGQRARILLGLTVSTFSTDVFTGTGTFVSGWYDPGTRYIGELAVVRVVGRATLTFAAWDLYRRAGTTNALSNPETKENVLNGELRLTYPLRPRLELEPLVGFRQWSPADYRGGRLYSAGVTARVGLTDRLSATVAGRFDDGWVFARGRGFANLTGYGLTMFLRYQQ